MAGESQVPTVMVFAGTDPSGGAGIQADIETLVSMGCHATPIVTALTVQDTVNVYRFHPVEPGLVVEQARAVFEDIPVAAIKIGMLGSVEIVEVIHTLLMDYPNQPVVLDPVVASGGGTKLSDDNVLDAMVELLFPLATIVTPNSQEARIFSPNADTLESCAHQMLDRGCEYVLLTGTHENTPTVINYLYSDRELVESYQWERLPASYHGSGCTLAVAIAGLLSQGLDPLSAVREAQEYTWEALKNGYRIGMGQHIPNRLFWAHGESN